MSRIGSRRCRRRHNAGQDDLSVCLLWRSEEYEETEDSFFRGQELVDKGSSHKVAQGNEARQMNKLEFKSNGLDDTVMPARVLLLIQGPSAAAARGTGGTEHGGEAEQGEGTGPLLGPECTWGLKHRYLRSHFTYGRYISPCCAIPDLLASKIQPQLPQEVGLSGIRGSGTVGRLRGPMRGRPVRIF